jgi:flagellar motor switch/type III secretory pathway protein FliN
MNTRPFILVRERDLASCRERAERALQGWQGTWGRLPAAELRCAAANAGAAQQAWKLRELEGGTPVWVARSPAFGRLVERSVFCVDAIVACAEGQRESALGAGLAAKAEEELVAAMLRELTGQPSRRSDEGPAQPLATEFRQGSGALVLSLDCGTEALHILLPARALPQPARKPATRRPELCGLAKAARGLKVGLTALVGEAEMTLGHLGTLAVGDVIPLTSRIGRPLLVSVQGGPAVCQAHLGAFDGNRAIELVVLKRKE